MEFCRRHSGPRPPPPHSAAQEATPTPRKPCAHGLLLQPALLTCSLFSAARGMPAPGCGKQAPRLCRHSLHLHRAALGSMDSGPRAQPSGGGGPHAHLAPGLTSQPHPRACCAPSLASTSTLYNKPRGHPGAPALSMPLASSPPSPELPLKLDTGGPSLPCWPECLHAPTCSLGAEPPASGASAGEVES